MHYCAERGLAIAGRLSGETDDLQSQDLALHNSASRGKNRRVYDESIDYGAYLISSSRIR